MKAQSKVILKGKLLNDKNNEETSMQKFSKIKKEI
jgi:hypothetical protein